MTIIKIQRWFRLILLGLSGLPSKAADIRETPSFDQNPKAAVQPRLPRSMVRFAEEQTDTDWVRAGVNTNVPIWGIRGGLLWGLPPATGQPADGPRGLIRLRYPVLPDGGYDLINFIAVEPIVRGQRGFSELEASQLDGVPGKRFWATEPNTPIGSVTNLVAGRLMKLDTDAECLTIEVAVERFDNGAHVGLMLSQRSDAPDELELTVHPEPDSAPIEYCILTATMGNKARARQLWLKDEALSSLNLYKDYKDSGFAPHRVFFLDRLRRTTTGGILVAITTDEADPAAVKPFLAASHWRYAGFPVTQYWRKPAGTWRDDLNVAVNARFTYWMSHNPIPGGVAFENFELRERFYPGQRLVFGITRRTPKEMGISAASDQPRVELAKWNNAPPPAVTGENQITRPEISEAISPAKNLSIPGPDGNTVIAVFRHPPGQGLFPVVIYLHGGRQSRALDQLRRDSLEQATMCRFLAAGYATVCATFRSREEDIQSPDAFRDCLALVAAVKDLPVIDPKSVVIFGQSGGGDLALKLAGAIPLAAIVVEEPATVIFTGVIHRDFMDQTALDQVIRNPKAFYTSELKRQTQENIRRISCPIFFAHGDRQNINFFNQEIFLPELEAAGKNMKIVHYPGQAHGFSLGLSGQLEALKFFKDCETFLRPYLTTQPSALKDTQFRLVLSVGEGN